MSAWKPTDEQRELREKLHLRSMLLAEMAKTKCPDCGLVGFFHRPRHVGGRIWAVTCWCQEDGRRSVKRRVKIVVNTDHS